MKDDIQEINWANFKAKFNGKEQSTFQWLCYLLFCEEYSQPFGISRYENHAGIENDPIAVGKNVIGWQAKFYDTRLSEHKDDLSGTGSEYPIYSIYYMLSGTGSEYPIYSIYYMLNCRIHASITTS